MARAPSLPSSTRRPARSFRSGARLGRRAGRVPAGIAFLAAACLLAGLAGGALLGLGSAARGSRPAALPAEAVPLESAVPAAPGAPVAAETARLDGAPDGARPGEPERAPPPAAPLSHEARLAELLDLLARRDAAALLVLLEELLGRGEEAFDLLRDFLAAGLAPPSFPLAGERRLALALAVAAGRNPEAAARLFEHLLSLPPAALEPGLRLQLLGWLPGFLALHEGGFESLREAAAEAWLAELAGAPGQLARALAGLEELGVEPPLEALGEVLRDRERRSEHPRVLRELGRRGDVAALGELLEYVWSPERPAHASLEAALRALAGMEMAEAERALDGLLQAGDEELRAAAAVAYFSRPRDVRSVPLILEWLDSERSPAWKRHLLETAAAASPELAALLADLGREAPPEGLGGLEAGPQGLEGGNRLEDARGSGGAGAPRD
jgi:hypothetical protein